MNLSGLVVDQILKVSQLTVELTYPPLGGSQLVNSTAKVFRSQPGHDRQARL